MAIAHALDISNDQLEDFRLDAADQLPQCEQLLIELEHHPDDAERLRKLFRLVHNLKGNLALVGLHELIPLPQALEDVLERLRASELQFDSLLGDVLLLTLDRIRALIGEALGGPSAQLGPREIAAHCRALENLARAPASEQAETRRDLLLHLDPHTRLQAPAATEDGQIQTLLASHGVELDADLHFFIDLMQAAERRSQYWQGRGQRLLELALAMNTVAGEPERPAQLAASVCLHDLGMAFLPLELLHKQADLSRAERKQMQAHPRLAYDLLHRLPSWNAAAEIALQHQEHADGSGYPKGLREAEIAPGALILHIVDTFDARTHERAHQTLSKRPQLRAILEINNLAGSQFSAHWVEVFNRTLQQHPHLAHR